MRVKKKKNIQISVKRIRRFLRLVPNVRDAFKCSLFEALQYQSRAHIAYRLARKSESIKLRESFQVTLAEALALQKGTDAESEAQNLRRIEQQRRQTRNVKRMRGLLGNSRDTKLWYTDETGSRIQCSTQHSMEIACFTENETRFRQTELTPPMVSPIIDDLGFLGDTDSVEAILAGHYSPPPGTDPYLQELLRALRMPSSIRQRVAQSRLISTLISQEDHCSGWKKRRLASAESSGLTMDHYLAGTRDLAIAAIDTLFRQLPYQHGFSPESWQMITDVEILKKAGVYDVELMRTIQLMHAEFNANNKKLGRDVMAFAESCQALAPEQFGSRKNHQAILAALNKRLTMDILRQRRHAGALCSNDAKSCYDRIVHNVATIALRRLGMPSAPVRSMFATLQGSHHHISTAFGVSKRHYGGHSATPLQGVG